MAFPGTEQHRDRKAGQKGIFPGKNGNVTARKARRNVWDRRAGTERLGSP